MLRNVKHNLKLANYLFSCFISIYINNSERLSMNVLPIKDAIASAKVGLKKMKVPAYVAAGMLLAGGWLYHQGYTDAYIKQIKNNTTPENFQNLRQKVRSGELSWGEAANTLITSKKENVIKNVTAVKKTVENRIKKDIKFKKKNIKTTKNKSKPKVTIDIAKNTVIDTLNKAIDTVKISNKSSWQPRYKKVTEKTVNLIEAGNKGKKKVQSHVLRYAKRYKK